MISTPEAESAAEPKTAEVLYEVTFYGKRNGKSAKITSQLSAGKHTFGRADVKQSLQQMGIVENENTDYGRAIQDLSREQLEVVLPANSTDRVTVQVVGGTARRGCYIWHEKFWRERLEIVLR